jgi:hypothetical protein
MAKKKAKGKSAKMPKKIGDTKLPKNMRNAGDMVASLVSSPMARELVADALIAVAGVLAGNKASRIAGAGAQAASGAKDLGKTASGAVAEVVADAARRILPSSVTGENDDEGKDEGKRAAPAAMPGNGRRKRKETPDQRRDH